MLSSQTYIHTHTHVPPPVPVGERYYLMESCFFLLLSAFPQTPCLPCQENNESTKPFVRTSTQYFHLRHPPIPKKTSHTAFSPPQCYLSVVPLLFHTTPYTASGGRFFLFVFFPARSRCAQDSLIVRWGGGRGVIEAVTVREGGTERGTESRGGLRNLPVIISCC